MPKGIKTKKALSWQEIWRRLGHSEEEIEERENFLAEIMRGNDNESDDQQEKPSSKSGSRNRRRRKK